MKELPPQDFEDSNKDPSSLLCRVGVLHAQEGNGKAKETDQTATPELIIFIASKDRYATKKKKKTSI